MNKDFIFVSCISLSITILKHSFWCVYRVNNFSQWSRCTASFFLLFYEGLDWGAGFSVISEVFGDFVAFRVHFADLRSCLSVKKKKEKEKTLVLGWQLNIWTVLSYFLDKPRLETLLFDTIGYILSHKSNCQPGIKIHVLQIDQIQHLWN